MSARREAVLRGIHVIEQAILDELLAARRAGDTEREQDIKDVLEQFWVHVEPLVREFTPPTT